MRGIIFTLEAVVTLIAIAAISSHFVFVQNVDPSLTYLTVANDVASLVTSENFWEKPLYQQQRVDMWGWKTSFCVRVKNEFQTFKSENCGDKSEIIIPVDRVYFDQSTGQMNAFTVEISPVG